MGPRKLISKLHQWWERKQTSSRGDTLVEVSIAIAVMGVIITGTTAIINRSILSVQNSIESIAMKNEVNGQSEMLHYIFDTIDGKNEKVGTEIVRIARSTSDISNYNLCTNNPGVDYKVFHLYSTGNSNNPVGLSKLAEYDARKVISSKVWVTAKYYESKKNSMDYIDFYVQSCWTPHGASTANGSNKAVARIAVDPNLTSANKRNNYYTHGDGNDFLITSINGNKYQLFSGLGNSVNIHGTGFTNNTVAWIDLDRDSVMDSNEECTGRWLHGGIITCNLPTDQNTSIMSGKYTIYVKDGDKVSWLSKAFEYKGSICMNSNPDSECQVDIDSNMIPVVYNGNDTVIANTAAEGAWYDYGQKRWANAVTVNDPSKYKGKSAGTRVSEDDILGYWVYIPRYAYEVQRRDATDRAVQPGNFNIKFEKAGDAEKKPAKCQRNNQIHTKAQMWRNGSANNSSSNILAVDYRTECGISRKYEDNSSTWGTHPGFKWGSTILNGIWIGKFETTGKFRVKSGNNYRDTYRYDGSLPTVKPHQDQLDATQGLTRIGQQFDMSKIIGQYDWSEGGESGDSRLSARSVWNKHHLNSLYSHMSKGTEWGAAVYLSASNYGAGIGKVRANNYQNGGGNGKTGCGPSSNNSCDWFTGSDNIKASTTNNAYGVYDMNGGDYEFQMTTFSDGVEGDQYYINFAPFEPFVKVIRLSGPVGWSAGGSDASAYLEDSCTWEVCGGISSYETNTVQSLNSVDHGGWYDGHSRVPTTSYYWNDQGGSTASASSVNENEPHGGIFYIGGNNGSVTNMHGFRVIVSKGG